MTEEELAATHKVRLNKGQWHCSCGAVFEWEDSETVLNHIGAYKLFIPRELVAKKGDDDGLMDSISLYAAERRVLYEEIARLQGALEDITTWAEGSTCEICGVKKMTDTDAYDYARKALKETP